MIYDTEKKLKAAVGQEFIYNEGISDYLTVDKAYTVVGYAKRLSGGNLLRIIDDEGDETDILYSDNTLKASFTPVQSKTDLTKIDRPFNQLPRETQLELFGCWLDGDCELRVCEWDWCNTNQEINNLNTDCVYRLKDPQKKDALRTTIEDLEEALNKAKEELSKC